MTETIEYRKFLQRLRNGEIGETKDYVELLIGGTKTVRLPRELLSYIPYFKNLGTNPWFVPYPYDSFKAIIDFMFDPEVGLDEAYYRAWRFFFCTVNISVDRMSHIPEILQIPLEEIVIESVDGKTFATNKKNLDYLFQTSEYFRKLFEHDISQPYTGGFQFSIDYADRSLIHLLQKNFEKLAKRPLDWINNVIDKYALTLDECQICSSTRYCEHWRQFDCSKCKFPASVKCSANSGTKCTGCETIHYSHGHVNCSKCQCRKNATCENIRAPNNQGYCLNHRCEHEIIDIKNNFIPPCRFCFCIYKYANGYCKRRLPCAFHGDRN